MLRNMVVLRLFGNKHTDGDSIVVVTAVISMRVAKKKRKMGQPCLKFKRVGSYRNTYYQITVFVWDARTYVDITCKT